MRFLPAALCLSTLLACESSENALFVVAPTRPLEVGQAELEPDEPDERAGLEVGWTIEETLGTQPGEHADDAEDTEDTEDAGEDGSGGQIPGSGCEALVNLPPGDTQAVALRIACSVWEDQGIERYSYEVVASGPAARHPGLAIVEVRDGEVYQVVFSDGQHGDVDEFYTVDEIFRWVGLSIASPAVEVELAFHPLNGAPVFAAVYLGEALAPIYTQELYFPFDEEPGNWM